MSLLVIALQLTFQFINIYHSIRKMKIRLIDIIVASSHLHDFADNMY